MRVAPRKLALLGIVYATQGIGPRFTSFAVPVLLRRQGLSLAAVGAAGLLFWPWAVKCSGGWRGSWRRPPRLDGLGGDILQDMATSNSKPVRSSSLESDLRPPRTSLGDRLLSLRRQIVASGEPLLSWEDLERDVAERRGEKHILP